MNRVSAQAVEIYQSAKNAQVSLGKSFEGLDEVLNKIKDGKGSFLSKIDRMNKIGGLSPKKQIPVDIFNDDPEPDDDPPAGGTSKKIPINNDKKTADLIANKKKIK